MPPFLYTLLLYIALPFVPLKLLWRGIKQREYWHHWAERLGIYRQPKPQKPVLWLHCVSVGETRAAEPLIITLKRQYPYHQILLTHTTPTGRTTSAQLFGDTVQSIYLPYDLPFAVKRFLNYFQPQLGMLMETELWFNLLALSQQKGVPLLLLNARLSEQSAKGYAKLGQLIQTGLSQLSAIAAQSPADAARFVALGAHHVSVTGNLKFDVKPSEQSFQDGAKLRQLFGPARPVFLAASTREGEEALILEAVRGLALLTVIVPRHPQRFNDVANLLHAANLSFVRRSTLTSPLAQSVQVVLGDSMGELFSYYAACDFTFVGGSLLPFGGQNLIEPATMGKPILIGEHTYNFAEASANAINSGAAISVHNVSELRQQILTLLQNCSKTASMHKAALLFSQRSTGATAKTMALIKTHLNSSKHQP